MKAVTQITPGIDRWFLLTAVIFLSFIPSAGQVPTLVVQTGHNAEIKCVAFSPDGRQVVSSADDGTAKIWDTATGRELRTLAEPLSSRGLGHVLSATFSADGKRVFTLDAAIKVWDASTGERLLKVGDFGSFDTFALSPRGDRFAVVTGTGEVQLYDAATGKYIRDLVHRSQFVWERIVTLAFSPDGKLIAGGSHDKTIKLWNAATGEQVRAPLVGHKHWVTTVAFSPDGKTLASAGADDTIRLWDISHLDRAPRVIAANVGPLVFTPDNKLLITGDGGGQIRLWDVKSGSEVRRVQAHSGEFYQDATSVAVSHDGKRILSGGHDAAVRLWDLATGAKIHEMSGAAPRLTEVALSPLGTQLVTQGYDSSLKLWDLRAGTDYKLLAGPSSHANFQDFSPDGKTIVITDDGIKLLDADTGLHVKTIDPGLIEGIPNIVTFTPDGKRLVTSNQDSQIKLWDIGSGTLIATLFERTTFADQFVNNIDHLAISPDGRYFVTATSSGHLALWDASTRAKIREIEGRVNVSRIEFSPDSNQVVAGVYYEQVLRFWRVADGTEIKYDDPPSWVRMNGGRFAFGLLGGAMVRAVTDGGKVKLTDAHSDQEIATLISFGEQEWAVTIPDGRFDTNKPLDTITGIHWIMPDDPMTPRPLELFMRQYYEPDLLQRTLRCARNGICKTEFKALPQIGALNRSQPLVKEPALLK